MGAMAGPGMAKPGPEVDQRSPKQLSLVLQIARSTPAADTYKVVAE